MTSSTLKLSDCIFRHALFDETELIFGRMCKNACDGMVLALVGPPQAGKSTIFEQIVADISRNYSKCAEGSIPLVHVQIQSVEEGRVKGKWLSLMLLKALRHPVYMHIGELDELEHYIPSRKQDEGSFRSATEAALAARNTKRVALDEAHLLTRTKKGEFRGHILESLKSLAAINRTLLLCGGYDLANEGLFDHPHFAGRTIVVDMGGYTDSPAHREEWVRILKHFSQYLHLEPSGLLLDLADVMLLAANGVFGLVEKWLWACKQYSEATHRPITIDVIRSFAPPFREQKRIAEDIRCGKEALRNVPNVVVARVENAGDARTSSPPPRTTNRNGGNRRAFERSPRRIEMKGIEIYRDD